VADLPIDLPGELAGELARVLDVEGKIPRALEALGPVGGRDVVLVDPAGGLRARQLEGLGARVVAVDGGDLADLGTASAEAVVGCWSAFRGPDQADVAQADRVLRPGGRLLAVHDYGRDDVSRLRGDALPEYTNWSRRDGPFLRAGFKIRVLHCFWTFESVEVGGDFLARAFGEAGRAVGADMRRPRITYNVAVYHRTAGETV
jgi:hypothetical protein